MLTALGYPRRLGSTTSLAPYNWAILNEEPIRSQAAGPNTKKPCRIASIRGSSERCPRTGPASSLRRHSCSRHSGLESTVGAHITCLSAAGLRRRGEMVSTRPLETGCCSANFTVFCCCCLGREAEVHGLRRRWEESRAVG